MNDNGRGNYPFSNWQYRPELNSTDLCNESQTKAYQQLLGMMKWLIELWQMNILYKTTILDSFLTSPQIGHLIQAIHIVVYNKHHDNLRI